MTPAQSRAARALLDWSQPTLAKAAGIGLSTVVDFEKERRKLSDDSVFAIEKTFVEAGIEFFNGTGVKLHPK